MSLYNDLTDVLTPYANKIKEVNESLQDVEDGLSYIVEDADTTRVADKNTYSSTIINSTGDIESSSNSSDKVTAIIVTGFTNIIFKVAQRISGANKYAFYSATTCAECNSSTLVGSVLSYTNNSENIVAVPPTANMLLIRHGATIYYFKTQLVYKQSKAEASINALAEKIDATLGEITNFGAYASFVLGRQGAGTEIVPTTNSVIASAPFRMDRTVTYEIADGYGCTIYYYKDDGVTQNGNNGGQTSAHYRTILAGTYIMPYINKSPVATITEDDIPELISAVTFTTDYNEVKEKAEDGSTDALAALMYQRGAAPKSFSNSGIGIICAGQSQMDGRVPFTDLPADITLPMTNAYSVNGSTGATSNIDFSGKWSVEVSLFDALSDAGINSYRVKYALGDTGLYYGGSNYNWSPFYEKTIAAGKSSLLRTLENYARKAMEVDGNLFDIRAFVWMQGEHDRASNNRVAARLYYENLKCLVAYIRGVVGNKNLPFICGTVSRLSSQYDRTVEKATLKVCEEDDNAVCIRMTRAPLLDDGVHLNATSAVYFGEMAFDALVDMGVISATKLEPTKPWTDYTITETYTNCTSDNSTTTANEGAALTVTITADSGYTLSTVKVLSDGEDITDDVYDSGVVTISSISGDIVIIATAS